MRKMMQGLVLASLLITMLAFTGCSRPTSASGVQSNFSPELHSTSQTHGQHKNMEARTHNLNLRSIWDDGARILMTNRPSRLTPYPTP